MAFNAYMHERNIYRNQPDFTQIALDFPEFRTYAVPDAKGQKVRVDFTNPDALRMLTKILLKKDFNLDIEIPQGFLIPTVPQRLNYILWIEDLLFSIPKKKECISGIDIGTGPCAIFSLLGARKNGWKFIATESSVEALLWAEKNINKNNLLENITVVKVSKDSTLNEVLSADEENYDFCLCNPPFFENIEEIRHKHRNKNETIADVAQKNEIFVKGGELDFVKNILKDSLIHKDRISLFTSMFGKKKSFLQIVKEIEEIKDAKFTTTEFCQGNTIRWGIAWTFNDSVHFEEKVKKKVKPKKTKPPLEFQIPLPKSEIESFKHVVKRTKDFLHLLQIPFTETRASKNFAELLLKSDKNTWSHQRRKRRELERQKKIPANLEGKHCSTASCEIDTTVSKACNREEDISSTIEDVPSENNMHLKNNQDLSKIHSKIVVEDHNVNMQAVKLENNQVNPSDSQPTEESDSKNEKNLQNKRKSDFISEDLYMNKKARIKEVTDNSTNDCSDVLSKNINSESKDSDNVEGMYIKTESFIDNKTDTKNFSPEKHEVKAFPSTSFSTADNSESSSVPVKTDIKTKTENNGTEESLILHCHLQFIKGKSKIYVKMNCPATADRNTMHQVFQLIKNKVN